MARDSLPVISFESSAAWESWLEAEHASSPGVWLKIAKKGASGPTVSYPDALAGALCFGWIDGQKGRLDDDYWLQRFTPRKPGSRWSRVNTDKAAALIEAGRMRHAGPTEVAVPGGPGTQTGLALLTPAAPAALGATCSAQEPS